MNDEQLLRYSRHILLPQIGIEGQARLSNAKVLIMGLGGLGAPAALYLAAAGVGQLVLCDFDKVDLSNLQRQIIHQTTDIDKFKVDSARDSLLALNPEITVIPIYDTLSEAQLIAQITEVDIVLDCSDNLTTRLAVNQACVITKTPLVSGAAIRMEGQLAVFRNDSSDSPCYRCLYRTEELPEETCTRNGVLAPIVGIIGSLQALEAMKLILNISQTPVGQLLLFDALTMEWCPIKVVKYKNCPVCGSCHE